MLILPTENGKDGQHGSRYQHPVLNGHTVNIKFGDKPIEKRLHNDPHFWSLLLLLAVPVWGWREKLRAWRKLHINPDCCPKRQC
jgi:hypothetical protein